MDEAAHPCSLPIPNPPPPKLLPVTEGVVGEYTTLPLPLIPAALRMGLSVWLGPPALSPAARARERASSRKRPLKSPPNDIKVCRFTITTFLPAKNAISGCIKAFRIVHGCRTATEWGPTPRPAECPKPLTCDVRRECGGTEALPLIAEKLAKDVDEENAEVAAPAYPSDGDAGEPTRADKDRRSKGVVLPFLLPFTS